MQTVRIVTCNVRLQVEADGEQQFANRAQFLCRTLNALSPDVIGFQEITNKMRKVMIKLMPSYCFLGSGREANRLGEGSVIAYKRTRLMPERLISDMLSPTPHIPGSSYGGDQSGCPRIFSSCDLMPIDGGKPFRVMNIHTDHIGKNARMLEVSQLLASYAKENALRPMPTFITGDFNALPDAPEIKLMTDGTGLVDITKDVGGTYHNYGRLDEPLKIDYIFVSEGTEVGNVIKCTDTAGGLYLSDHYPILAELKM